MAEEWCRLKLMDLHVRDHRCETLSEIRDHLNSSSSVEDRTALKLLTSSELFDCLNTTENEEMNLATDILSICMSNLTLDTMESQSSDVIERSLNHPNLNVRSVVMGEILNILKKNPSARVLNEKTILLIIGCMDSSHSGVGLFTVDILSIVLLNEMYTPTIKAALLEQLTKPEVTRCRVYEIAINLAKSSTTMMYNVKEVLDHALHELEGNDILVQLNILELLVSLAEQNHGLVYLENEHVFEKIERRVELLNTNPLDTFLVPGIMKFFGKIAYSQPNKMITGYPNMVNCLFDCICSNDVSILPTAFDTLGNLAHSSHGKLLLEENYPEKIKEAFEEIAIYLRNLPADLKTRCFNALEIVYKTEGLITENICKVTKKWFYYLSGENDMQFLMSYYKNPFPDIKIACLEFIKSLCQYPWGILALKNTAGFIEYLLDRRVEFNKDAKYAKYEVISILANSSIFDAQTLVQINKYVNEGPYYVEGIVEVAVDGS